MRLLLFGGTFDPPHIGHMGLLQNAIRTARPDAVTVMPDYQPPHKENHCAPPKARLAMCACFAPLFLGLRVSGMEIARGGKSYTIDTLEALRREDPGARLYLAIGGDMLCSFQKWKRYRDILRIATLVAQNRGEAADEIRAAAAALEQEGGCVLIAEGDVPRVSSTEIRAGIKAGRDMSALIPPPADEIVRKSGLYR